MFLTAEQAISRITDAGFNPPQPLENDWYCQPFKDQFPNGYREAITTDAAVVAFCYPQGWLVAVGCFSYSIQRIKQDMYNTALSQIQLHEADAENQGRLESRIASAHQGYGDLIDVSRFYGIWGDNLPLYRSDSSNKGALFFTTSPVGKEVYSRITKRFSCGRYEVVDPRLVFYRGGCQSAA